MCGLQIATVLIVYRYSVVSVFVRYMGVLFPCLSSTHSVHATINSSKETVERTGLNQVSFRNVMQPHCNGMATVLILHVTCLLSLLRAESVDTDSVQASCHN